MSFLNKNIKPASKIYFLLVLFTCGFFFSESRGELHDKWSFNDIQYVGFDFSDTRAQKALREILSGKDFSYGIPTELVKWSERIGFTDFLPKSDKDYWSRGFIPRPPNLRRTDLKRLPLSFSRGTDKEKADSINISCLNCHVNIVAGRAILGAPAIYNDSYYLVNLLKTLNTKPVQFASKILLNDSEQKSLAGFLGYASDTILPSLKGSFYRGDQYGVYVVWTTLSRLVDPEHGLELAKPEVVTSQERELLNRPFPNLVPNPWWLYKYKDFSLRTADISKAHPLIYSFNFLDNHPSNTHALKERYSRSADYLYMINQIKDPEYPMKKTILDEARRDPGNSHWAQIGRGRKIFNNNCVKCHGQYDQFGSLTPGTYPNIRQLDVETDSEYWKFSNSMIPLREKLIKIFRAEYKDDFTLTAAEKNNLSQISGYAPPPLVGIWASAPYFHNDSVPTIHDVLNSKGRPQIWLKSSNPMLYNHVQLGLNYQTLNQSEFNDLKVKFKSEGDLVPFRMIYNTTEYGKGNGGHPFGDALSEGEREDLIEFMKLF
jgi:hypothetical protein